MAIEAHESDAIAGLYSGFAQCARESGCSIGELAVAVTRAFADDGGGLRKLLLRVAKKADRG